MAALRAMLQLRSNSQPNALLPSQQPTYHSHNHHSHHSRRQKYQPEAPSSSSSSIQKNNNSNSNNSSTMTVTYKNSHNTSSNNSSVSSVHSLSTGSLHHGHSAFGAAAAAVVAATHQHHPSPHKSPSSSKKQAPFQNLGLHSGAALGNLGLVKFALDNGQPIDSVVNGVSAIHAACCSNANVAVVLFLIERGADVNARRLPRKHSNEKGVQTVGTTGSTPLHFAAANGCLNVVDILLRHGAIVDMTDKYGSSPLSVAAARNHPEVASLLRQYSAMQRGVQDLTPELESKDPIAERRVSSDRSSARSSHERNTRSQSPQQPTMRPLPPSTTTRVAGQRRISLPSIVEGPSSPNVSAPPRQSCDFGRQPHSTEPLAKSATFIRSTPSVPNRNYSKSATSSPFKSEDRPSGSKSPLPSTATRTKKASPGRTSMQRSHTSHGTFLAAPDTHASVKRRRSMESVGFLSPQAASASTVNRRKSFDHLSAMTSKDSKARRSSDASTDSQGTTSSGTAVSLRTVDTAASDPPSEISLEEYGSSKEAQAHAMSNPIDSGTASHNISPLTRSMSQPVLENLRPHRPVTFATEPAARQSLDIQMLMSNQQRQARQSMEAPRNDSDPDLPQQLYRRRTMQENDQPKMVMIPRNLSMGPTIEVLAASGSEESMSRPRTSTSSSVSLQESAPRHSTGSYSSGHSVSAMSFSGSATVSGRFSRMWSSGGKENGPSAGNWNVGEFAEASGEAAAQGLVRSDQNRSRSSMLNRLSGIWSRR